MDKETLSNYGWIVICVLVLAVMIALATPFGTFVADAIKSTTQGLFDVNQNALNSTGLINIGDQSFGEGGNGGNGGNGGAGGGEQGGTGDQGNTNTLLATFSDNTWEQIIEACQNNAVPETWAVGDKKAMTINGQEVNVTIIGKNHDIYADGSGTAPLTFQTDIVELRAMNSTDTNAGGWDGSEMYNYLNGTLINNMEFGSSVKAVNKITNIGYKDAGEVAKTTKTTSDKLFLLSAKEVVGDACVGSFTDILANEGTKYEYFTDRDFVKKSFNGQAHDWWTRTPIPNGGNMFNYASNQGINGVNYASDSLGVAFAFCF